MILAPERQRLRREALASAWNLCGQDQPPLGASQIRGLVEALASAPGRQSFIQRHEQLARYIAWRTVRKGQGGEAWSHWAKGLSDAVRELETQVNASFHQLKTQSGYWVEHSGELEMLCQTLTLEVIEVFLYALERTLTVQEEQREAQRRNKNVENESATAQ